MYQYGIGAHKVIHVNLFSLTLSTVLLSEEGVLPAHSANLHGSPSMCSVTPNSDVYGTAGGRYF